MTLSVLGIACSPRRNGNTTRLLLEAMKTAQVEGHRTELVYLSEAGEINEHPTALDDVRQATQALIIS
jgi:multimeric flavodoxin WrbA